MTDDEKWMRVAIEEASKARWPFGAVIVSNGELVASAGSGDGRDVRIDPTAHAEVNAIRRACEVAGSASLKGMVMYASCEPCALCMSAAWYAELPHIIYGSPMTDEESLFKRKDLSIPGDILKTMTEGELVVEAGLLREEVLRMYHEHPLYKRLNEVL